MLNEQEIMGCAFTGEKLRVNVHYDTVELSGVARCDIVTGMCGRPMLRAKFGHSIKAILDFDLCGKFWEAERDEPV